MGEFGLTWHWNAASTCADPEKGTGVRTPPPLKNHKNIGFLSDTGPDPPMIYKATKPAFNVGPAKRHLNGVSLTG